MIKVMTIVGTRPELIKMSRVICEFDKYTNHVLVHTGQNYDYELNQVFFDELEIRKPDYFLGAIGSNPAQSIAQIISKSDEVLEKEKPDAVLLYGDTNSCLAVISAKRRKIPIFHMEAGNRCFDQVVPEELNRKIVDHLSDINLVLTEHARRYLIAEGIGPENIIKTGSHMNEVINFYQPKIIKSKILETLQLTAKKYFVVSIHREENVDDASNLECIIRALDGIADQYRLPVVVSTHPRTRIRLESIQDKKINSAIYFLKPFGFFDYIKLQMESFCVISDSGTVTEESALLGFPAVTIRNTHERPEGMDAGVLIMSGILPNNILDAINVVTSETSKCLNRDKVIDYDVTKVSQKILRIVLSYTEYVNRNVWHKY